MTKDRDMIREIFEPLRYDGWRLKELSVRECEKIINQARSALYSEIEKVLPNNQYRTEALKAIKGLILGE